MSAYARRRDGNHAEIVQALRQVGASVIDLANLGRDVPDIAVYYRGDIWMLEIKSAKGRIRPGQRRWLEAWPGHTGIVRSAEDAINLIARAA